MCTVPRRSRPHHSRARAGGREQHVRREGLHLRHARALWRRNRCRTSPRRRARSRATSTAALFTTTLYDALKRATSTANAVGTTSMAYAPWRTKITDPNGNPKDLYRDAFGNLASVVEYDDFGRQRRRTRTMRCRTSRASRTRSRMCGTSPTTASRGG